MACDMARSDMKSAYKYQHLLHGRPLASNARIVVWNAAQKLSAMHNAHRL
jgi:hypothetical protein